MSAVSQVGRSTYFLSTTCGCALNQIFLFQIPREWLETVDALFQQCSTFSCLNDDELLDSLCMQLERVLASIEEAFKVIHGLPA